MAQVKVKILGDATSLERSFKHAATAAHGFNRAIGGISFGTLAKVGGAIAGLDLLAKTVRAGVSEFADQQKATAQTQAVLKSTGAAANVTAKQVDALAASISNYSGIDDEAVQAGENMLLTFVQIQNRVGKTNDIFAQATKATADLSVAMGIDMKKAALQVGKALNDPERGYARLQRIGVAFTKSQVAAIKGFSKLGETAKAQKVILAELTKEFGGSARALGDTIPGKLKRLQETFKNLAGSIVGQLAPAFDVALGSLLKFSDELTKAKGLRAKFDVVFDTTKNLAGKLQSTLSAAVAAVDWDAVWAKATGIGDGLQARIEQVDFSRVGERIGQGIADSIKKAASATKEIAGRISDVIAAIDFVALGKKIGPGLAAAMVMAFVTLTDPMFWIKNWDLALAVAASVFTKGIGRIAGKLGVSLALAVAVPLERLSPRIAAALVYPLRAAGKAAADGVVAIVGIVERLSPRIAAALLRALVALPGHVVAPLAALARVVADKFKALGTVSRFVVKVLGIQAVIDTVVGLARDVSGVFARLGAFIGGALDAAWEVLKKNALRAALEIVEPFNIKLLGHSLIPGMDSLVKSIKGKLDETAAPAKAAGESMATSYLLGAQSQFDAFAFQLPVPQKPAGSTNRSVAVNTTTTPSTGTGKGAGITAAQRNTWFDASIKRSLDIVADITSVQGQIAALKKVAATIVGKISVTKDKTRRLNLGDQLRAVQRQMRGLYDGVATDLQASLVDLSDKLKLAEAKALGTATNIDDIRVYLGQLKELRGKFAKATSDGVRAQIQSAINSVKDALAGVLSSNKELDRLDKIQSGRQAGRALEDAQAQMHEAKMLGGPIGIKLATRALEDAKLEMARMKAQGINVGFSKRPGSAFPDPGGYRPAGPTTITVNINGANQSPEQIAKQVIAALQKKGRQGVSQHRGTAGGINRNAGIPA